MEKHRLPDERRSLTHKVRIDGQHGDTTAYITAGYYDEGPIGEVFLNVAKHGSTLQGALDSWAILMSQSLQIGVPMYDLEARFTGTTFEPSGRTSNPNIPQCSSLIDYTVKWMGSHANIGERDGS